MLGQACSADQDPPPALQVEADQAASLQDLASRRNTRSLWTGFSCAALALILVTACAPLPLAPHAYLTPSSLVPGIAFNPSLPSLSHGGRHPGIASARPLRFRPAFLPSGKQRLPISVTSSGQARQGSAGDLALTILKQEQSRLPQSPAAPKLLLDGRTMPAVGLGVYRVRPGQGTYRSVRWALEAGYRMVDTAQMYKNEEDVGRAIRDSGLPREEIFVQSKLDTPNHGYGKARRAIEKSLKKTGLKYFDCFLIHSPYGEKLVETWDALLALHSEGLLKSVGVANFGVPHLEALAEADRPRPVVNQFEMHPLVYRSRLELIEYCQSRGILVQAYGSLFGENKRALKDHRLADVARAHPGKSPELILLRWALQKGFQVIPKSVKKDRILQNLELFDFQLSAAEEQSLSAWEPEGIGEYWDPVADAGVDLGDVHSFRMKERYATDSVDLIMPLQDVLQRFKGRTITRGRSQADEAHNAEVQPRLFIRKVAPHEGVKDLLEKLYAYRGGQIFGGQNDERNSNYFKDSFTEDDLLEWFDDGEDDADNDYAKQAYSLFAQHGKEQFSYRFEGEDGLGTTHGIGVVTASGFAIGIEDSPVYWDP